VVDTSTFHPGGHDKSSEKARLGLDPNRLTITFVGNLVERKRAEWVLRAASDLQHEHLIQVVLVGAATGPDRYQRDLRRLAEMAPEPAHVHFLGHREDVADVLRASDVATLPSIRRGEAFPRAVVEAMACGVPIVATDVAGVKEAVTSNVTGLLVDPDDHGAYVAAIDTLLRDRPLREGMGRRAAIEAKARFSGATMAASLLDLYLGALRTAP
jgi:glycosyltransferase involved in cell wall biosynthesis